MASEATFEENLKKIEAYLNSITTLQAAFVQKTEWEAEQHGSLYLDKSRSRGQLRLEYKPPAAITLVTRGRYFIYYDAVLDQLTHIPQSDIPLSFLLSKNISLSEQFTINGLEKKEDILSLTLEKSNSDMPPLTFVFAATEAEKSSLELLYWYYQDANGTLTKVRLIDTKINTSLPKDAFFFANPRLR